MEKYNVEKIVEKIIAGKKLYFTECIMLCLEKNITETKNIIKGCKKYCLCNNYVKLQVAQALNSLLKKGYIKRIKTGSYKKLPKQNKVVYNFYKYIEKKKKLYNAELEIKNSIVALQEAIMQRNEEETMKYVQRGVHNDDSFKMLNTEDKLYLNNVVQKWEEEVEERRRKYKELKKEMENALCNNNVATVQKLFTKYGDNFIIDGENERKYKKFAREYRKRLLQTLKEAIAKKDFAIVKNIIARGFREIYLLNNKEASIFKRIFEETY